MKYAIVFTLLAIALVGAASSSAREGWWWVAIIEAYASLGLFAVAIAYAMRQAGMPVEEVVLHPRWSIAARFLLVPYRTLAGLTLGLSARVGREEGMVRVVPGLYVGRRPSRAERRRLAEAEIHAVLDLCAEFPHPGRIAAGPSSRYVPILDGSPPSDRQFREAVEWIMARRAEDQTILIHCAQGHGRSATIAAVAICRLGLASGVDEAIAQVQSVRPGARPSRAQRMAAIRFLASIEGEENAEGAGDSAHPFA